MTEFEGNPAFDGSGRSWPEASPHASPSQYSKKKMLAQHAIQTPELSVGGGFSLCSSMHYQDQLNAEKMAADFILQHPIRKSMPPHVSPRTVESVLFTGVRGNVRAAESSREFLTPDCHCGSNKEGLAEENRHLRMYVEQLKNVILDLGGQVKFCSFPAYSGTFVFSTS